MLSIEAISDIIVDYLSSSALIIMNHGSEGTQGREVLLTAIKIRDLILGVELIKHQ